jgi:hypothetical protein
MGELTWFDRRNSATGFESAPTFDQTHGLKNRKERHEGLVRVTFGVSKGDAAVFRTSRTNS